jgi:ketosteroid isomerase-like protein
MSETNVDLARRGYESIMRGDLDAIRDLLDPNVRWHAGDPDGDFACKNRDQALQWMRRARARRGSAPAELIEIVDAGDSVVVIMKPTPEGDELATTVANVTTFRGGKVVEMVHYDDPADARAAAGV